MHQWLKELHQDHVNLGRVLRVMAGQLEQLKSAGSMDLLVLQEIVEYVRDYPDLVHHAREDVILNFYQDRFPAESPVVERLLKEHAELRVRTLALKEALQQCCQDSPVPRERMAAEIADYLQLHRDHLNAEEEQVYRLVQAGFSMADWDKIGAAMPSGADPLFGDLIRRGYENICDQVLAQAC